MNMETIFAVAVDGPAGSGKSTVAKEIAKRLGILYIDTGAMYRTVGYAANKKGISLEDEAAVTAMLPELDMKICPQEDGQKIYLEGEDVTQKIRTQEAGKGASIVAAYAGVRQELVQLQQKMAQSHSVIMDGRDIATTVLPQAQVKIYLDASVEERAKRRVGELQAQGKQADLEVVKQEILQRDDQDMHRAISPLRCAPDATVVDTTGMDIAAVVETLLQIIAKKVQ